ncbi:hypothetical protein ACIRG4_35305 [Streptomyces sp. NPDC102395]|uniref:hypothetical protein n=1 Tax=Streptomyces sp. NPDC102395 TaxID=3366168 RepID=UPI00383026FE
MAAILPIASDNGPRGRPTKSSGTGATRESATAVRRRRMSADVQRQYSGTAGL